MRLLGINLLAALGLAASCAMAQTPSKIPPISIQPFAGDAHPMVEETTNVSGRCGSAVVLVLGAKEGAEDFFDGDPDSTQVVIRQSSQQEVHVTEDNGLSDHNGVMCVSNKHGTHLLIWSNCGGSACSGGYGFTVVDVEQPEIIAPLKKHELCDETCASKLTGSKIPYILNGKTPPTTLASPSSPKTDILPDKTYESIDVADIKVNGGKLEGKYVEVSGLMGYFMEHWSIRPNEDSSAIIYVDTQFLPRDVQKAMLACHIFCRVTLRGEVNPVAFGDLGVTADSVDLQ